MPCRGQITTGKCYTKAKNWLIKANYLFLTKIAREKSQRVHHPGKRPTVHSGASCTPRAKSDIAKY